MNKMKLFKFPRFVYHNKMDTRIWANDDALKPDVNTSLMLIAHNFINSLQNVGLPLTNDDIIEVTIHGSSTDLYYDATSDIDLCIVADLKKISSAVPGIKLATVMRALKNGWIRNFRFKIYGRGVDVTIADVNSNPYSNGHFKVGPIYSVLKKKWLNPRVTLTPPQVKQLRRDTWKKFRAWRKMYKRACRDKMGADFLDMLMKRINQERTLSYDNNPTQPVTPEVMAFRMMRQCGYIRDLQERSAKYRSKNFNITKA